MTTITLYRGADCWLTHWQGEEAATIQLLYGTTILPTGFTAQTDGEVVRAFIARLNPAHTVCLA
jgi:hypothetical protein